MAEYRTGRADLSTEQATLLDVWQRNPPAISHHRFAWMYGPDSSARAASWMLRHHDSVVGSVGLATRLFRSANHVVEAGQSIDLVVDRGHRTIGPALMLQRAVTGSLAERNLAFIYAFPTDKSDLVLKRAGYFSLGPMERWTRVLNAESNLRGYLPVAWAVKSVSRVLEAAMWARSGEMFYRRPPGVRTEVRQEFDDRFDALWRATEQRADILGQRTVGYLSWRFAHAPHSTYYTFCLERPHGQLVGYVVYYVDANSFIMADVLTRETQDLDELIPEFLGHARSEGMASVSMTFLGWEALGQKLRRFGFWRRPENSPVLLYVGQSGHRSDDLERAKLFDRRSWYLTEADRDV